MDALLGLSAVALLILANGWFVLGEFAFVAARRAHVSERAAGGDRRARRALAIMRRLSFMLSGAQLGITATSLLIGYLAEPVFRRALGPVLDQALPPATSTAMAVTIGLVLATTAQMVFGELAPKNLAIARPETFSYALAPAMHAYLLIAGPVIRLFDGAANRLLRLAGIEPAEELRGVASPEELGVIITESGRGGTLTDAQAALLARVLDFRSLRAADAMVPRPHVVSVPEDATCESLRRLALASGHSRFPVVGADLDDVRGVVHVKDVLRVPFERRAVETVGALRAHALIVPESAPLATLLADLRASRTQLAVVVDEHGGTAGVLALEDIVEELVGQIRDEYDLDEPAATPLPGGGWLVPGSWRPDEVARDTGYELPTGDYDTVSGFVMERLGRVPAPGDTVDVDGLLVQVESMDGHAVGRLRLLPRGAAGEAPQQPRGAAGEAPQQPRDDDSEAPQQPRDDDSEAPRQPRDDAGEAPQQPRDDDEANP